MLEREGLRSVTELHVPPDAVVELPERHMVFGIVVPHREPVAIRFDVEENPRAAVRFAPNRLELQADRTVGETVDALENRDRVVGELLRVVHQLF
jgi:hypothetical protein